MLRRLGILAIVLAGLPTAALAVDRPNYWTVEIGADAWALPRWQGADGSYIFIPVPTLDIRKAGTPERFHGPRDGFGFALIDTGQFRAGPVGMIRLPRREDKDGSRLAGLGDVGTAYEVGIFVEYLWAPWLRTRAEVRQGWGGHDGIVADLFADAIVPISKQFTLSAGPRITLASTAATAPYFSVTAVQAASGLPLYDAKGGVRSVGAGAKARYLWNQQWGTHVFVEYERLTGDAANSPIVTMRGSRDQWMFGAGVTYSFDTKAWW